MTVEEGANFFNYPFYDIIKNILYYYEFRSSIVYESGNHPIIKLAISRFFDNLKIDSNFILELWDSNDKANKIIALEMLSKFYKENKVNE